MLEMLFFWSRLPVSTVARVRAGPWFAWFATAVLLWRCRKRIARTIRRLSTPLQPLVQRRQKPDPWVGSDQLQLNTGATTRDLHELAKYKQLHRRLCQHHYHLRPHKELHCGRAASSPQIPTTDLQKNLQSLQQWRLMSKQKGKGVKSVKELSQMTPEQHQMRARQSMEILRREAYSILTRSKLKRLRSGEGAHILAARKLDNGFHISQQLYYKVTRSGRIYGEYVNWSRSNTDTSLKK